MNAVKTYAVSSLPAGKKVCPSCKRLIPSALRVCECGNEFYKSKAKAKPKVKVYNVFEIIDQNRADKKVNKGTAQAAVMTQVVDDLKAVAAPTTSRVSQLHKNIGETLTKLAYYHLELAKLV